MSPPDLDRGGPAGGSAAARSGEWRLGIADGGVGSDGAETRGEWCGLAALDQLVEAESDTDADFVIIGHDGDDGALQDRVELDLIAFWQRNFLCDFGAQDVAPMRILDGESILQLNGEDVADANSEWGFVDAWRGFRRGVLGERRSGRKMEG
jgi:hypothetical protein